MHDGEVHPRFHLRRDEVVGRRIVRPQELECLLREHQAEAEHRVRRILLDDADAPMRMPALRQIREIDAGRAGADDEDIHLLEKGPQVLELVEEMPRCKPSCGLAHASPQMARAASTHSFSLARSSASVTGLPPMLLAKPHCGLMARRDGSTYRAASSARRRSSSSFSSVGVLELTRPSTTPLSFGR